MSPTRAPRRRTPVRTILSFGERIHVAVGALVFATAITSLVVAVASRHVFSFELVALVPAKVWALELWRAITWSFVEGSPFALLFTLFALYWFGGDLAVGWGPRRFLRVYAGMAAIVTGATCVLGFLDPDVMAFPYLGARPLTEGLIVAWGLSNADRQVLLFFVLPLSGRWIAGLTIFLTIATAAYFGWEVVLPDLLAEALMVAYVTRPRRKPKPKRRAPKSVPRVVFGKGGEVRLVDDDGSD